MRCAAQPWDTPHGRFHEALLAAGQGLQAARDASEISTTGCNRNRCQCSHLQVCKLAAQGQRLALPLAHLPPQPLLLLSMAYL